MQNRAIRDILNNVNFATVRGIHLLSEINLMDVRKRRDYFMILLMFKCIHGQAPVYWSKEVFLWESKLQSAQTEVSMQIMFMYQ